MIMIKRVISWIATVVLLLAVFPAAAFAAWEHGDKGTADFTKILIGQDKKEYYINENVKTLFYKDNGKTAVTSGSGRSKVRWRYLKISDKTDNSARYGYCVEFGAGFSDTASYKAYDSAKDKTLFQNMPEDTQTLIATILCYGRNGSRKVPVSGANDADYYFATQILIWEAQQGLRTITKSKGEPAGTKLAAAHGMAAKHMYQCLKGRPAEKCYDWLLKRVNDHLQVHSFASAKKSSAPVHVMTYNEKKKNWSVTLTDKHKKTNGLKCSHAGITITRNGSAYTLESSKEIKEPILLTAANQMSGGSASGKLLVWNCITSPSNQAMIMGSKDKIAMYLKVRTEEIPTVMIEKQDKETGKPITGSSAIYEILDQSGKTIAENLNTGTSGSIRLTQKLTPGKYQLREVQAPSGYLKSKELLPFSVKEGAGSIKVIQEDVPQKCMVKIHKTGDKPEIPKESSDTIPLEGVVFQILAAEDIITADGTIRLRAGEIADTMTTDSDGNASSIALYPGNYNIVEKEAPEGYRITESPIPAELRATGQETELTYLELNLNNELKQSKVEITKTDVSTGEPLPDTGIEILDEDKKVLVQTRTDSQGKAVFQKLPPGSYYFREFDAPEGYQIDETPYSFEIKESEEIIKCEMTNRKLSEHEEGLSIKPSSPQKPESYRGKASPQTGDSQPMPWPWFLAAFMAIGTIFLTFYKDKRY